MPLQETVLQRPPSHPVAFARFITRDHRAWAYAAIAAVLTASAATSLLSVLLKLLVDALAAAAQGGFTDTRRMWIFGLAYPLGFFLTETIWRCSGFCGMNWITSVRAGANRTLFGYLTEHSATYFNERFAGALVNKISNAAYGVGDMLSTSLWEFLPLGSGLAWSLAIALWADWRLGAILASWIVVFLGVNAWLVWRKQPQAYAVAESGSVLKGKMVDSATNIASVHLAGHNVYERGYMERYIEAYRVADVRSWWLSEWILFVNGGLIGVFICAMVGTSMVLLQAGMMTIGTVVMIVTMVLEIVRALFFIGHKMADVIDKFSQIREGLGELLVPHDVIDAPGAKPLDLRAGAIRFDAVSFSYGRRPVFERLELDIPAGQKVGLVGFSGAGKTTLVSLLLRQYDLDAGAIRIDEQDIASVTRESLRRTIAVVPQDVSLFHRSIAENIRYGRLEATDEEVREAARLAQADAFISSLPAGYGTTVGERGVKLSGGQRQRIAIARAILKNAPILVLDEATSSLDSESESAIQEALGRLMAGKTVLAVAHRLSTLQAMDRLIVLEAGRIAEDGTHAQLLKQDGIYARLWRSQVQGFIQE